ncbi:hypothetical protein DFR58_10552 [Anaerobacterium chartisolvens]|uniref:Uncharacterized protein n=1 Tax=Anaerobacterium chartisolvens TaxID=1297424 RepID=A0A369B9T8_9FIRM|nr:hypothetical protein [Anaerobacterium chartisolvens]RCX18293.1 hypothetical protein DFR58_10552 [Anaerobacterium chartisolvens]
MKKLVLVLVCTILMTVFLAFNYLLWDKKQNTESLKTLEYSNENKDATIDALGRQIKNLEDSARDLESRVNVLEGSNSELQKEKDELIKKQAEYEKLLKEKSDIIDVLKSQMDLKPLETAVRHWVQGIDEGQYDISYKLEAEHFKENGDILSQAEYADRYKKIINSIKLKSIKLQAQESGNEAANGRIALEAELEVGLAQGAGESEYSEGVNKRFFEMTFDKAKNLWLISGISA